jgi:cytochrome c oxidase subunit 4
MENPEYLTGIPLAILAGIGLVIAFSLFFVPEQAEARGRSVAHGVVHHPEPYQYVIVGIILAAITAFEVVLYYLNLNFHALVVMLIALSAVKFLIVVGFFMHLRFDAKLFSLLFFGGLALAIAIFTVAITTLQAGLV